MEERTPDSLANPYAAPLSVPVAEEALSIPVTDRRIQASLGQRFLNFIIDRIASMAIVACAGAVIGIVGGSEAAKKTEEDSLVLFITFSLLILYYVILETCFGRTIGKWITGTKVVDESGNTPSLGKILGRTFCRVIPFEPFSFLGSTQRGWHDSIPKTWVVRTRGLDKLLAAPQVQPATTGVRPTRPVLQPRKPGEP